MRFIDFFWRAWERAFIKLPGSKQAEVMAFPGGLAYRELAAVASEEAYLLFDGCAV